MPDDKETQEVITNQEAKQQVSKQSLEMVLAQLESHNMPQMKLTEAHVDKLIDQRGVIIEKIHKDREGSRYDKKFVLVAVLIFSLIVIGIVAWTQPDYLSEVIIAFISGGGGLGIGYGIGKGRGE